jgi:hypothetical protein
LKRPQLTDTGNLPLQLHGAIDGRFVISLERRASYHFDYKIFDCDGTNWRELRPPKTP